MLKEKPHIITQVIFFVIIFFIGSSSLAASNNLTENEKNYIKNRAPIIAASITGGAPMHFKNSKGEISGIAIKLLDKISSISGLKFEYKLYDTIDEAYSSDADILFGLDPAYTRDNIILSIPYMKTNTILFMNPKVSSEDLSTKTFALIKGGKIPDDIQKENVLYFDTRKETLDAVNKGEADYGYGNEYSIAYYRIKYGYENIITVPKAIEEREYSLGLFNEDKMLLSILNKSIASIDDDTMNEIILNVSSNIKREITLPMVFKTYGLYIFIVVFIFILILLNIIKSNIKARRNLSFQNRKYQLLTEISNECVFEYDFKLKEIYLFDKCEKLFESKENLEDFKKNLSKKILADKSENNNLLMTVCLSKENCKTISIVTSKICYDKGRKQYIIGKMTDISHEVAEKQQLINESKIDGLTKIYNHITTKQLINERIKNTNTIDALLILDCDKFKSINDTYGHLEGDNALQNISSLLVKNFSKNDIIGRIGGDEFCVYAHDIKSLELLKTKCEDLIEQTKLNSKQYHLTFSIGIKVLQEEENYEELLANADKSLYIAKKMGGAKAVSI
jgi:diguanylate cyclase (GGDEF)-like protein